MYISIASASEVFFEGEALSLSAPAVEGTVTILPHHIPLVTALSSGEITVKTVDGEKTFSVHGGVLEVTKRGVSVLL